MAKADSHTLVYSTVFVGAASRVAQLVAAQQARGTAAGDLPLRVARRGGDVAWDMAGPPPPLPVGAAPGVAVCFAGATPRAGADLRDNAALAVAAQRAARAWGVRHCLHLSSAAVYGDPGPDPVAEHPAPRPASAYGQAKLEMERALFDLGGADFTILRLGNVAGAGQPFDAAATARDSLALDRFADGAGPVRSFIGPATLARVLRRLGGLAAGGTPLPRILNVAAPRPTAMADILSALHRRWHWRTAPAHAIQTVWLDTAALSQLCPLPQDCGDATRLVHELPKDVAPR